MMITKEYAKAYTEVIEILKYVPDKDVAKIPKEKLDFYKSNMDLEYKYEVDLTKDFGEQELSDESIALLANIFRDYWATPYQRERIEAREKYELEKIEEEKRNKYNPEALFKNKNENIEKISNNQEKQEYSLVEYKKEKIFTKIISKIKAFLQR